MIDPTLSMSNLHSRIGVQRAEHIARFTEGLRKAGLPE
jgi:hypothetical protein